MIDVWKLVRCRDFELDLVVGEEVVVCQKLAVDFVLDLEAMVSGWETVDKLFYKLLNNEILPSLRIECRVAVSKKSKPKILKYFPEEFKMWILRNNGYCLWNPDLHILILSTTILNWPFINKQSFKQAL